MDLQSLKNYLVSRGQESSTWRGLIMLATGFGAALKPEMADSVITVGIFLTGAVGALLPDAKKKDA